MAGRYILGASFISKLHEPNADAVFGDTQTEKSMVYSNGGTGKDRLLRAIKSDEFGNLSPEANTILQVGCMSMFIGSLYGGVLQSRVAYMDFFRNNQATVFRDHIEAKKKLQEKVTLAFGRGAFRWGWRLTFFSTTYIGISTGISVYRDKSGIMEHLVAGAVTGTVYKFNLGPRGWIIGGGLGLVLGLIAGGTTLGLLKLSGMTMEEVRRHNNLLSEKRVERYKKGVKEYLEKEELAIIREHNRKVGDDNISLDTLESS